MKKVYFNTFKLLILIGAGLAQQTEASLVYDDFLKDTEAEFDKASTRAKKYEVISQPINLKYLERLRDFRELDIEKLKEDVSQDPISDKNKYQEKVNFKKTTPLTLAVSLGKAFLTQKFLTAVDDVNSRQLTGWGYRQPYTLAHMALDPQHPMALGDVSLDNRLMVIDILAEHEVNFNDVVGHNLVGIYHNPPLAAGKESGRALSIFNQLRARALLYGADPIRGGSCFRGIRLDHESELLEFTLNYYIERIKAGARLNPTPAVKTELEKTARKKNIDLILLLQNINKVRSQILRLEKQVQGKEAEIRKVKLQKTKKAKRKETHLRAVLEETQNDIGRLNRTLKKL